MDNQTIIEAASRAAHETNRSLCLAFGDVSQKSWDDAPAWQKESTAGLVRAVLSGEHSPEKEHERWMAEKLAAGWKYGRVKNEETKENPALVPYAELPASQRVKDDVLIAVVLAVSSRLSRVP